MSFSGCFGEPSSAFRFTPFSCDGTAGRPSREPALLTSETGRTPFAFNGGRAGGCGGAGDLSPPIELTMSLKRLILYAGKGESEIVERVKEELRRSAIDAWHSYLRANHEFHTG
jgi:hypothetical protein